MLQSAPTRGKGIILRSGLRCKSNRIKLAKGILKAEYLRLYPYCAFISQHYARVHANRSLPFLRVICIPVCLPIPNPTQVQHFLPTGIHAINNDYPFQQNRSKYHRQYHTLGLLCRRARCEYQYANQCL